MSGDMNRYNDLQREHHPVAGGAKRNGEEQDAESEQKYIYSDKGVFFTQPGGNGHGESDTNHVGNLAYT